MPLGNLYKKDVKELAKELGVPQKIIDKIPTAGLWKEQTDEDELGVYYNELDKILPLLEKNLNLDKIQKNTGLKMEKIKIVKERFEKTEFKRKPIEKP
jgi:NAD+ synthase